MPSELPGLFSKLALEYCSPPSPFAIAEYLVSWFELDAQEWGGKMQKYQTRLLMRLEETRPISLKTEEMRWQKRVDVVIFRAPRPFQRAIHPMSDPAPIRAGHSQAERAYSWLSHIHGRAVWSDNASHSHWRLFMRNSNTEFR